MHNWQAVIFDLDDTLYAERDYVLSGFNAIAAWADTHLGIPAQQGFAELKHLFEQGVRGDTFNRWLLMHRQRPADLVPHLVQVYREHQPYLVPFVGVTHMLDALHQHYRLGLLSDGYLEVQQRKLAALNVAHYFDAIVFPDQWGRTYWKPSTKPFEVVLQQLKVAAEAAVYIADNPLKDFLGARQVGMSTVWLRRTDGEYVHRIPPTAAHAPHAIITSLSQLPACLATQQKGTEDAYFDVIA